MTSPDQPYSQPAAQQPAQRPVLPENIVRGAMFALLALPAGVIVWVIIWSLGVVASVVAWGVAFLAVWLYRKGSGGAVSVVGAVVVTAIVAVTLIVSFFAGMVADLATAISSQTGMSWPDALFGANFWPIWNLNYPAMFKADLPNFGFALLFGVLGSYSTLRRTFRVARATQATRQVPQGYLFGPDAERIDPETPGQQSDSIQPTTPSLPASPERPAETQLNPEPTGTFAERELPDDDHPRR